MRVGAARASVALSGVKALGVGLYLTFALSLGASPAKASNGGRPRTPVVFQDQPCLSVIDRGASAPVEIQYSIPKEDTELTEDELPDSRTARVYAVCGDQSLADDLPNWIDYADAERSLDFGIIEELPPADEVLETSTQWPLGSCVFPILGAEPAIPLTCEATSQPASWDAQDAPSGAYAVRGYTFEPDTNLWSRRLGVLAVRGPDEPLPAAGALMSPSIRSRVYAEDGFLVAGCAVGPQGTTVQLQWAAVTAPDAWTTFHTADAATTAEAADFLVDFAPPPEAENQAVWLRVIVTPPDGDPWTGYAVDSLLVSPGPGESDSPDVVESFNICAVEDDGDTDDGAAEAGEDTDAGPGGGCRMPAHRPGLLGVSVLLLLALRRRRGPK